MEDELDKKLSRLKKLLALASANPNANEAALAARKAVDYLDKHPLPVRWFVRKGVVCHIVPALDLVDLTRAARLMRRDIPMRKDNWFLEVHRVRQHQIAAEALAAGYFCYQRYGFTVFVPARSVEVYV